MRLIGRKTRQRRHEMALQRPTPILRTKTKTLRRWKPKRYGHMYADHRWLDLRAFQLANHPICQACGKRPAVDVDHLDKHAGSWDKFLDPKNLASVCQPCHRKKTSFERRPSVIYHDPDKPKPKLRPAHDMNPLSGV